jgi:hypothetical protein
MKNLFVVIAALAMALTFVPKAEAGDTAQLGLKVTFDQELAIWSEPAGPFEVVETGKLEFKVIAEDLSMVNVFLEFVELPKGARWIVPNEQPFSATRREGTLSWVPEPGQAQSEPYFAIFLAKNSEGEEAKLVVEITVIEAMISIELTPTSWVLEGVKLGEIRSNLGEAGMPIHRLANTGNCSIGVRVRHPNYILDGVIHPGTAQDVDTYVTWVGDMVLDPDRGVELPFPNMGGLPPNQSTPVKLEFGAPTDLSVPTVELGVEYDIIAYLAPVLVYE